MSALYARRGMPATARRFYTQAMRAGRRHGLQPVRGDALHGLMVLMMDARELDEAQRYAGLAKRAYGREHPRLSQLIHDTAQLYVAMGRFGRAIPLLQKLLPHRHGPAARAFTLALIAHAAGGTGERRLYEESWSRAWSLLDQLTRDAGTPRALLELARAAAVLSDWLGVANAANRQDAQSVVARVPRVADEVAQLASAATRPGAE